MPLNSIEYEKLEKPTPAAFKIAERDSYPDTVWYTVYKASDPLIIRDAPAMIVEGPSRPSTD